MSLPTHVIILLEGKLWLDTAWVSYVIHKSKVSEIQHTAIFSHIAPGYCPLHSEYVTTANNENTWIQTSAW